MKIRMKVAVSGTRNGRPWPPIGEEVDLPDHEAKEYCSAGLADPVAVKKDADAAEKAVAANDSEKRAEEPAADDKRRPGRPRKV